MLLVIVILLIGIGIGLAWSSRNQKVNSEHLQSLSDNYDEVVRPLLNQKRELEDKLYALDEKIIEDDFDLATAIIVITEEMADARVEIIPAVEKAGFKGYITYDRDFLRGKEGDFMSAEELRALKEAGWSFCLEVTEKTYIAECFDLIEALDLPAVDAAFFPHDGCTKEQLRLLNQFGIYTLIQYNDGELKTEDDEKYALTRRDGSQGPWMIRALGSNDSNSSRGLYDAVVYSECVALTVGYTDPLAEYDKGNLRSMLSVLKEYNEQERLEVSDLDLAWERLQERRKALAQEQEKVDQERDRLEKALEQVVREIREAQQDNQVD